MSDFPDFVTWARLRDDEWPPDVTDDDLIAAYDGTLLYAAWEFRKAWYAFMVVLLPGRVVRWLYE